MTRYILSGDFGATNLRAAIVSEDGEVLTRRQAETPANAGADAILEQVVGLLSMVASESPERPEACCIAIAGLVDAIEGKLIISPNAPKACRTSCVWRPKARSASPPRAN